MFADGMGLPGSQMLLKIPSLASGANASDTKEKGKTEENKILEKKVTVIAPQNLTWKAQLNQLIHLTVKINDLLTKQFGLCRITSPREAKDVDAGGEPKKIYSIFQQRGTLNRNGAPLQTYIEYKKIVDLLALINDHTVTEKDYQREYESLREQFINSLKELNATTIKLKEFEVPETIGPNNELLCHPLRSIVDDALKITRVYVSVQKKLGDTFQYDRSTGKMKAFIRVSFFTNRSLNLLHIQDPKLNATRIPDKVEVQLLWGKKDGDVIPNPLLLDNVIVHYREVTDSCDHLYEASQGQLLHSLVAREIEKCLLVASFIPETVNTSSINQKTPGQCLAQRKLEYFEELCGREMLDSVKASMTAEEKPTHTVTRRLSAGSKKEAEVARTPRPQSLVLNTTKDKL